MTPEPATRPGGEPRLSDEELERFRANAVSLAAVYPHYAPHHTRAVAIVDELRALRADLKKAEAERDKYRDALDEAREVCLGWHEQVGQWRARAEALRKALEFIADKCCMQFESEPALWCKKDGSAHSIYCPVSIARAALKDGQP